MTFLALFYLNDVKYDKNCYTWFGTGYGLVNLLSVPALRETEASDTFAYEVSGALEFERVGNWRIEC